MYTDEELQEYLVAIRRQACTHCPDRAAGGPPCSPLGQLCSVELQLPLLVEAVHKRVDTPVIETSLGDIHSDVCGMWVRRNGAGCLCHSNSVLALIVHAVETVDSRRLWRQWLDLGCGD